MKKITVYEKPTCTTCRNLAKLLKEHGIDYEKVNYFIDPLSAAKIKDLLKRAKIKPIDAVRKAEPDFKKLKISAEMSDDKIISLMVKNPNLIQRPIVEVGRKVILARPAEKVLEIL
ncbi:MAG: ArsC/Spx/MgsR family protein [Acidobacteriota bacterium]